MFTGQFLFQTHDDDVRFYQALRSSCIEFLFSFISIIFLTVSFVQLLPANSFFIFPTTALVSTSRCESFDDCCVISF